MGIWAIIIPALATTIVAVITTTANLIGIYNNRRNAKEANEVEKEKAKTAALLAEQSDENLKLSGWKDLFHQYKQMQSYVEQIVPQLDTKIKSLEEKNQAYEAKFQSQELSIRALQTKYNELATRYSLLQARIQFVCDTCVQEMTQLINETMSLMNPGTETRAELLLKLKSSQDKIQAITAKYMGLDPSFPGFGLEPGVEVQDLNDKNPIGGFPTIIAAARVGSTTQTNFKSIKPLKDHEEQGHE